MIIKIISKLIVIGVYILVLFTVTEIISGQPPQSAALDFEKKCYSCHNIGGGSNKRGPDLKGVTERRTKEWLQTFIISPEQLKRKGDPTAVQLFNRYAPEVMPDQTLTPTQIDLILALIEDLSSKGKQFIPTGATLSRNIMPTDAGGGLNIFTGQAKLKNGGTACASCHHIEGLGILGGGTLGPDLTGVNVKFHDPELISILQNPNFPTMKSMFATQPLTDEEIVQLFALFQAHKNASRTVTKGLLSDPFFPLLGFGLLALALVATNQLWKKRLRGVRDSIVRRRRE
ncbi:MAG: cytochrome c [Acidobacteriota bacterium]